MSIFSFTPTDGLLNKSAYPTSPATEDQARGQIQSPLNQLRDYINANCLVKDGSLAFANTFNVGTNGTISDNGSALELIGRNDKSVSLITKDSSGNVVNAVGVGTDKSFRPSSALTNEISLGSTAAKWKDVWCGNWARASNGYNLLTNGMIIQWGEGSYANGATVTFPVSFPSSGIQVFATATATTATPVCANTNGVASFKVYPSGTQYIRWLAIGW